MLNEIREYEQYTMNPQLADRLKYKGLVTNSSLVGIRRPMIIIARNFIFRADGEKDFINARNALIAWCKSRLNNSGNENVFSFEYWLDDYLNSLITELNENKIQNARQSLANKENNRRKSIYKVNFKGNDANTIFYDDIIAEAFHQGPLKKYYLFVNENVFLNTKKKVLLNGVNYNGKQVDVTSENGKKFIDKLFKLISAVLLNRAYENQQFININKQDICNWFSSGKIDDVDKIISGTKINDTEDVFEKFSMENAVKLRVNPSFLEKFALVEESDFAQFSAEHICWSYYCDNDKMLMKDRKY